MKKGVKNPRPKKEKSPKQGIPDCCHGNRTIEPKKEKTQHRSLAQNGNESSVYKTIYNCKYTFKRLLQEFVCIHKGLEIPKFSNTQSTRLLKITEPRIKE